MDTILKCVRTVKTPVIPADDDGGDWEDYRAHLEAEEAYMMMDRHEEMEKIRRADFNNARSAACRVRGIAACLGAQGFDGIARQLLAASEDVLNLVTRYA